METSSVAFGTNVNPVIYQTDFQVKGLNYLNAMREFIVFLFAIANVTKNITLKFKLFLEIELLFNQCLFNITIYEIYTYYL